MTVLNPTVTGVVSAYSVSPALPAGIAIDATSGQISGVPVAVTAQANYTITASNASGSTTFNLSLTVNAPPKFSLGATTIHSVSGTFATTSGALGLMQFADLDGNGWDDLVLTGAYYPADGPYPPTPRQGYVALSGPTGFSANATSPFPFATMLDVHAREFAFVDLNGDGVRDVFIADHGYDAAPFPGFQNQLFLSQSGTANWINATANLPQQYDFTHSVCTGDVNADGKTDIFAGNGALIATYFLRGDGTGHFVQDSQILPINSGQALQNVGVALYSCALADLDGDGLPELVLGTGYPSRSTQVLWNVGGTYAADSVPAGTITSLPEPTNFGTSWLIYELQSTDLNGDGQQDLIVVYQGDVANGGWLIQFLINQGNHQFQDQTATYLPDASATASDIPTASSTKSWIAFLLPMDLNGDGRMDYWVEANSVGGNYDDNLPVALLRQANGSFVPVKVGELRVAGAGAFFLSHMGYARRGASLTGELVQAFRDGNGQIQINAQPITFY